MGSGGAGKGGNAGAGGAIGFGGIPGRDGGPGSGRRPWQAAVPPRTAAQPRQHSIARLSLPCRPVAQSTRGMVRAGTGNLAWQLWANNASNGSITTFTTPAFSAAWNNAGDYLARLGFEWGNSPKTYDAYGTITSAITPIRKTGTGGGYSYIGIYGWSTNPCIEWYIVDDSFNGMPVNPVIPLIRARLVLTTVRTPCTCATRRNRGQQMRQRLELEPVL